VSRYSARFESNRVATISRALVENSLRMRAVAFLSQVKMSLMLDTLREGDEPLNYMREIRESVGSHVDDWITLPVRISNEARELQQMTLTMERRREELRTFLAEQTQELRRSEQRYRQLMELIPDPVGVHRNGCWTYANPAMLTVFGAAAADELLGAPVLDRVHADDRARVLERMQQQIDHDEAAPPIHERLLRLDGSEFMGEVSGRPFEDDGESSVLVVMRDVTERVQAVERMTLLTEAVMQSKESIMILDTGGVIETANAAAAVAHGRSMNHLIGTTAAELRGGQIGDALFQQINSCIQQGNTWEGEVNISRNGGEYILARRVSPVMGGDGCVTHQIVVDRDITEEKQHAMQLEHTQRLESLGILAGGIAHDFNNILTAIMGNAAMAERGLSDASPTRILLERIGDGSRRASDLCRQMLAYSGKGHFEVRSVDLTMLVDEMTRLMEVSISKNVVIKYHLSENLPAVEADVAQMQQVILNLITNANEAIGDKSGVISFSTGVMHADAAYLNSSVTGAPLDEGRYVYLEVSDTGCGMDTATVTKIFDPFFTTKFTGRGLGMSAVLGIVRGHHGALRVYSEQDKGTTFKMLLPVLDRRSDSVVENIDSEEEMHAVTGTVLVVDDEDTIREVAAMMLEDMGFEVMTAENGLDALAVYQQYAEQIVIVLLDLTMPKMDGKACFRELRRLNPNVKVILSSGYSEEDTTTRFVGKGLAGFLQKPYSPQLLQQVLLKAVG